MQTVAATFKAPVATRATVNKRVVCLAPIDVARKAAAGLGVGIASLALASGAFAATVKLGADSGALVFEPASVTIAKGDSVTWVNNAGFPHNIVFDEDAVPSGVNAESLSHEDYLNAPGEKHTAKFDTAGEYSYYCEPHQGAGMQGKVIVN